ncbi:MAG: PqqD family protein [Planctomycetia bacterium]|jgi:hypothetical protein|nr:PqqD family protein [Planctomycetia bacterium]
MHTKVRINHGPVVCEQHADEVIAINLETGAYYSLQGPACRLWSLIEADAHVGDIIDSFTAVHTGPADKIAAAVHEFLRQLEADQLIVPDAATGKPPAPAVAESAATPVPQFELQKYSDMEELLRLDPVHDVGGGGWPEPATAGGE